MQNTLKHNLNMTFVSQKPHLSCSFPSSKGYLYNFCPSQIHPFQTVWNLLVCMLKNNIKHPNISDISRRVYEHVSIFFNPSQVPDLFNIGNWIFWHPELADLSYSKIKYVLSIFFSAATYPWMGMKSSTAVPVRNSNKWIHSLSRGGLYVPSDT